MMNKHFDNFEEAQEAVRKTKGGKVKRDPKGGFIVEFKSASSPTVIPLDESPPTVAQGDESSPSVIPEDEDTVRIVAEPRHRDFQAIFIESLALPQALLEKANLDPSLRAWLLQDAKWRIDFPRKAKHTVSKEFRAALSIAQKILLRGNLTLLSPSLEQELVEKSQSNADAIGAMNLTGMHLGLTQPYPFDLQQLEGEGSEEAFYRDIVPGIIGANFQRFVFPQLYIRSLVKGLSEKSPLHAQRVDFYINTGDRKCVVEIDGPEHEEDKENDDKRDRALRQGGVPVLRITNEEVKAREGPGLDKVREFFKDSKPSLFSGSNPGERQLISSKLAHQIQVGVVKALVHGHLPVNKESSLLINEHGLLLSPDDSKEVARAAIKDLKALLEKLFELYDIKSVFDINLAFSGNDVAVERFHPDAALSFNETLNTDVPTVYIQDIPFHHRVAIEQEPVGPMVAVNTGVSLLEYFLTYIFRHQHFHDGQHEAISRVLSGEDTIVLLPTGAGKSVVFQLTSILQPGLMIVVSPLLALINDQLDNLRGSGIDRVISLTSEKSGKEQGLALDDLKKAQFLFGYVAPERFQNENFLKTILDLKRLAPISLIAVDEVHCLSEWGHDFRPAYLNIGQISREQCKVGAFTPPVLALTGTASPSVLGDIRRELGILDFDALITPATFDRPNINFQLNSCPMGNKEHALNEIIKLLPGKFGFDNEKSFFQLKGKETHSGIIFCPHVNGKLGVKEIKQAIEKKLGNENDFTVEMFSGSPPYGELDWVDRKKKAATGFKNNNTPLLVATNAFGMGIDKPNIRYTVHITLPCSIEQYYQEAGRSGRDGKDSLSVLLYSNEKRLDADELLNPITPPEKVNLAVKSKERNDVLNALYFHSGSFKGIEHELNDFKLISNVLRLKTKNRNLEVPILKIKIAGAQKHQRKKTNTGDDKNQKEKVLSRLKRIGVVANYTIEHKKKFKVVLTGASNEKIRDSYLKYVGSYNEGRIQDEANKINPYIKEDEDKFLRHAYSILIDFIYDTIEKGRRRALREMVSLSDDCLGKENQSDEIRQRILAYFHVAQDDGIEALLKESGSLSRLRKIVIGKRDEGSGALQGGIQSSSDANALRGRAIRYLEDYATNTGVLLLRGFAELRCLNGNVKRACEEIIAGVKNASQLQLQSKQVFELVADFLIEIFKSNREIFVYASMLIIEHDHDNEFLSTLLNNEEIDEEAVAIFSQMLLAKNVSQSLVFSKPIN